MENHVVFVNGGVRQAIKERLGVSDSTISLALNFKTDSAMCRRIRSMAVNEYRGVVV